MNMLVLKKRSNWAAKLHLKHQSTFEKKEPKVISGNANRSISSLSAACIATITLSKFNYRNLDMQKNRRSACPGSQRRGMKEKELTNQSDNSINHSGGARKKLEFDMLAESLSARKHPRSRILFIIQGKRVSRSPRSSPTKNSSIRLWTYNFQNQKKKCCWNFFKCLGRILGGRYVLPILNNLEEKKKFFFVKIL
jgi:hypothetical protein